ncbi:MAG: type II toxin-antitoxin system VapC family toxin, partial [Pseudolabrys sp.]
AGLVTPVNSCLKAVGANLTRRVCRRLENCLRTSSSAARTAEMIIDTSAGEPLLFKGGDFAHTDIVAESPAHSSFKLHLHHPIDHAKPSVQT